MKVCLVLMGPIAGSDGNVNEGGEIILEDSTAKMFAGWGYVEILRDADDGSTAAGKVAVEPDPEPAATTTRKRATPSTEAE
jgi:hypothetical protein